MKNYFVKLWISVMMTTVPTSIQADVEISEANFPDAAFRTVLMNLPEGKDGMLTDEEISGLHQLLILGDFGVSSLKGIEFLSMLNTLECENTVITTLDLSKNTELKKVLFDYNRQLTSLNVSGLGKLSTLSCRDGSLSEVNVTGCSALDFVDFYRNDLISLDLSSCVKLRNISCCWNKLESLKLPETTTLTGIICSYNKLTALNVSGYPNLTSLHCAENNLTILDLSANKKLTKLDCGCNQLSTLDVSNNKELTSLCCNDNPLGVLCVTNNAKLEELDCHTCQLEELDLSKCKYLWRLWCLNNRLTTLDLSNNPALDFVSVANNRLTELDVSACTVLTELNCSHNKLTSLDFTGLQKMCQLTCYHNNIDEEHMSSLVHSLPQVRKDYGRGRGIIYVVSPDASEQNVCTKQQVGILKDKNWEVYTEGTHPYEGSEGTAVTSPRVPANGQAAPCYTLDGRRVTGQPTKGVYIQDGKKVLRR